MRYVPAPPLRPIALALGLGLGLGLAGPAAYAQSSGPAFGDSGWVAPLPIGTFNGTPTDSGPRVAEPQSEPAGETVLRMPFRILFFPLRLVARGLEEVAGVAGAKVVPRQSFGLSDFQDPFSIAPVAELAGGPGPALGAEAVYRFAPERSGRVSLGGTYSLWDTRKLFGRVRWGGPEDPWGFDLRGRYTLRPNERFNGIGNFSSKDDRGIWLGETGRVDAAVHFGSPMRQAVLLAGWRSTSARNGWNGKALPGALDEFTLDEMPGMLDESQTLSYGLGGDFALIDDRMNPTRGVHVRAEARQVEGLGSSTFDYVQTHLEARAYVPVFSPRRVLALRAVHQGINPEDGEIVPFYLLPDFTGPVHLAGYTAHRFIDNHLALARAEYRWLIWENRLWAIGIAEIAEVASSTSRLRIADVHESYGGGLRLGAQGTVMRATVAKGTDGLLVWFSIVEDF